MCREWVTLFEICILLLSKFLLWYVSAAYAVMWCPSVCLSVTFMDSVEMSKHIFRMFSPPLSTGLPHHSSFSSFPYQTLWQYSDGEPVVRGIKCGCGRQKSRFSANIWLHRVLWMFRLPSAIHSAAMDCAKLMSLVAGMKLLFVKLWLNTDIDKIQNMVRGHSDSFVITFIIEFWEVSN